MLARDQGAAPYKRWLDEDVCYVIHNAERTKFLSLSSDTQRDRFIAAFWDRRDPTPGTVENEFKEEHYRRLAFANTQFAANIPGWKTDRGRTYILYGSPDEIEKHDSQSERRVGANHFAFPATPYEIWHYRHTGQDITVKFVDRCICGNFVREKNPEGDQDLP